MDPHPHVDRRRDQGPAPTGYARLAVGSGPGPGRRPVLVLALGPVLVLGSDPGLVLVLVLGPALRGAARHWRRCRRTGAGGRRNTLG